MNYGKDTSMKADSNLKKETTPREYSEGAHRQKGDDSSKDGKVPILRGCMAAKNGGCLCSGVCNEVIGWRDKKIGEV